MKQVKFWFLLQEPIQRRFVSARSSLSVLPDSSQNSSTLFTGTRPLFGSGTGTIQVRFVKFCWETFNSGKPTKHGESGTVRFFLPCLHIFIQSASVFQPFWGCWTQNDLTKLCGTQMALKKTSRNPNFSKKTKST
jgi:hypothetical protein